MADGRWEIEIAEPPEKVLERLSKLAEEWDAAWQWEGPRRGRLGLPLLAGVRRGWVAGPIEAVALGADEASTRLVYTVDAESIEIDRATVGVLTISGAFGLLTMIAPFFEVLWPLLPVSIVIALAAWFFVVARLRNSGPEEFLERLAEPSETDE